MNELDSRGASRTPEHVGTCYPSVFQQKLYKQPQCFDCVQFPHLLFLVDGGRFGIGCLLPLILFQAYSVVCYLLLSISLTCRPGQGFYSNTNSLAVVTPALDQGFSWVERSRILRSDRPGSCSARWFCSPSSCGSSISC